MTTTSTTNRICGLVIPSKNKSLSEANKSTIAILIRLFATRIVANSFLGFTNKLRMIFIFLDPVLSSLVSRSGAVSEKNAFSAPEIMAEQPNKTTSTTILVMFVVVIREIKSKLGGSISKIVLFVRP